MPYVSIQLTVAGTDTGPFNLYSNADGFASAFESNVPKSSLLSGIVVEVPVGTIMIRITSVNTVCSNYIDIPVLQSTTTTTSTTGEPTTSTTTSSTTEEPTTSTSTTTIVPTTTSTSTTESTTSTTSTTSTLSPTTTSTSTTVAPTTSTTSSTSSTTTTTSTIPPTTSTTTTQSPTTTTSTSSSTTTSTTTATPTTSTTTSTVAPTTTTTTTEEIEIFDFKLQQDFVGVATGGTGTGTSGRKVELFSEQGAGFTTLWYNNKGEHPYIEDFGGKRVSTTTFQAGVTGSASATDFGAKLNPITDEIYISYRLWFSAGFDFSSPGTWWNGKLPGFRGKPSIPAGQNGTVSNGGPVIYPNWRGSRNYFWTIYHHGSISTGNGGGDSMGKGQWGPTIETGRWIDLDMRVVMNTNGVSNGILQIWIDGSLVTQATVSNVILRKASSVQSLEEFVYITSSDWDTIIPQTQQLYIADIHIWKYQPDHLAANTSVKRGFQLWESGDTFISPLRV